MTVLIKVVVDRTFIKLLALKALGYFCGVGGGGVGNGCWGARNRELEIFFCEMLVSLDTFVSEHLLTKNIELIRFFSPLCSIILRCIQYGLLKPSNIIVS